MTDYFNKNREGQHIVRQVKSFQRELEARDQIRQFPTQSSNSNSKPQSFIPWGAITITLLLVLGGALIVKSVSLPNPSNSTPSNPSINSLPSLPSIAPSN